MSRPASRPGHVGVDQRARRDLDLDGLAGDVARHDDGHRLDVLLAGVRAQRDRRGTCRRRAPPRRGATRRRSRRRRPVVDVDVDVDAVEVGRLERVEQDVADRAQAARRRRARGETPSGE